MHQVIALVGRPNVGKSTLFNQLTRSRDALVANFPGLTRDRKYGVGVFGGDYLLIDTGGIGEIYENIDNLMADQTRQAIDEADQIIWLVDARDGMTGADEQIEADLRQTGKPVTIAVNKTDGLDQDQAQVEFHATGFSGPFPISASHKRGLRGLMTGVLGEASDQDARTDELRHAGGIRLAFVGRPNVGKSTLINRIMGEERVVASPVPGTTRDSIFIPFSRDGQDYTLIDTAGVRRRGKVRDKIEKFSIVKTLQAIEHSDVVIHLFDAQEGVTDQDISLVGHTLNAGRAVIIALNKWDGLSAERRVQLKEEMKFKMPFLDFAEQYTISALHGTGIGLLYKAVKRAHKSSLIDIPTARLTAILEQALKGHQPPLVNGRRIKLRYAHQGGKCPPIFVIHGNQTKKIPGSYRRYLSNYFRKALKLVGTPIQLDFKSGENPYATPTSRASKLTASQRYRENRKNKTRKGRNSETD